MWTNTLLRTVHLRSKLAILSQSIEMPEFTHLHCHTQYSLLDGHASVQAMLDKAVEDEQKAAAITDHGNMFGVFEFVSEARKRGVKPIIGCEFYLVEDRFKQSFTRGTKDRRYHQLLLAKNEVGYRNISKLCSLGYIEGLYQKFPRVDRDLIRQHSEGLIATSCCIGAEVPQTILHKGEEEAERIVLDWLDIFGDDYFIELQRHGLEDIDGTGMSQEDVNRVLIRFSEKHGIPLIATNDSHYVDEQDASPHDILLCVNTGSNLDMPKGRGKGKRFAFDNDQFYFKSGEEMARLFHDVPQAIENTMMIADRIETPELERDILLPNYTLPEGFSTQGEYLRHITYEGARRRYGEISEEVRERLDFELQVIEESGFPGYFLIVQDFTNAARELDVWVGPGRGSAAGSAVAYCIGITNVDPIKYNLLFERFLNPERVSMPDIDIDFEDAGRQKVIDYVIDKYGKEQVAQIITYGTMAAKSAIQDVGRVMGVDLKDVARVKKAFPMNQSASLGKILADGGVDPKLEKKLNSEDRKKVTNFRTMAEADDDIGRMIRRAGELEGAIRNTGVHACGVIITPDDIRNHIPVATAKDSDLWVTQYDNSVVESAGLLKMDFLGLKNLSIIKDSLALVSERRGIDLHPDEIPLDDDTTYQLFQRGHTNGVFQFESAGMQKWLKLLKPTRFEDLIAMNALYRPGPMDYIPDFIDRKHGRKEITYDLPEMEEFLEETYGITVYQEQVMLLSQKLAGFTKGQADMLRKGMGKKKKEVVDALYPKFMDGCAANGHPKDVAQKIWTDWESFASYAFNKSHSTCYAELAYQTGFLKANYPEEYMAALLDHNMGSTDSVAFFMEECKRMGITVLGPDINESGQKFTVNANGQIRFALSAIKGVGQAAVEEIVAKRADGPYGDLFDLVQRIDLRTVNRKALESLALAGAFDGFQSMHRAQFFHLEPGSESNLLEQAVKFGNRMQNGEMTSQASLFGGDNAIEIRTPDIPDCEPWTDMEALTKEREVTGMYLSGHPLDAYRLELTTFRNTSVSEALATAGLRRAFGGVITGFREGYTKKRGDKYAIYRLEDFEGSVELGLFGKDYLTFADMVRHTGSMVFVEGRTEASRRENDDKIYFRTTDIYPLSELRDRKLNEMIIDVPADLVDDGLVDELTDLLHASSGDHGLRVNLVLPVDEEGRNGRVRLLSRRFRVDITSELVERLKLDLGLEVSLN